MLFAFTMAGVDHQYDNKHMLFSEAMEMQKATGLTSSAFEQGLIDGDALAYGALFWLVQLRALVTAQSCTLKEAVKALPFADFDFNLAEAVQSFHKVVEPDPTPAPEPEPEPDGSAATTSPGTSAPLPPANPSNDAATPTSESSPSSSPSAPGSGTA